MPPKPRPPEEARARRLKTKTNWRRRNKDKQLAAQNAWKKRNPDKVRAQLRRRTLRRHGLTEAEYEERLKQQGGVCAICRGISDTGKRLAVDHDHKSGKVRGLLCAHCNTALGSLRDDPALLRAAALYLEEHIC